MRKLLINTLLATLLCLPLSACTIHKLDVQQGNVLNDAAIENLKIGMNKGQVRFILGTPLIQDPFHAERWDYIYLLKPGKPGAKTERKQVTVYFEDDVLVKIDRML